MKHIQQFEKYLSQDIQIDITNATSNNDDVELRKIISKYKLKGEDLDFNYNAGFTPLLYAALFGCYRTLQVLIHYGVNLNKQSDTKWTALMYAADRCIKPKDGVLVIDDDFFKSLKVLLKSNADWNIINNDGESFIDLIKSKKIMQFITKNYADKYEEYLIKKNTKKYNL